MGKKEIKTNILFSHWKIFTPFGKSTGLKCQGLENEKNKKCVKEMYSISGASSGVPEKATLRNQHLR